MKFGGSDSEEDLNEQFAEIVKLLNFLLNGGLDSLNIKNLTADKVTTGTLDAGKVTVRVNYGSGAYIEIGPNGMVINDGIKDTFEVTIDGKVTMTSATIQSDTGYPKVTMDPSGNLLGAYLDANNYIEIQPSFSPTGSPTMYWGSGGSTAGWMYANASVFLLHSIARDLTLETEVSGNIVLKPVSSGFVIVPSIHSILGVDGTSPAQLGAQTGAAGNVTLNGGIPPGTQLAVAGGGSVTWNGITVPAHTHTQS